MRRANSFRQDAAVSEVLGVALMVGVAATLAGVMFVWHGIGQPPPEAPLSLGVKSDGPLSANAKQFIITNVSTPVTWAELGLALDQSGELSYDSGLSGNARYCIKLDGATCVETGDWDPETTTVKPGQIIRVRDMSLAGQKLEVTHLESGGLVATAAVGS